MSSLAPAAVAMVMLAFNGITPAQAATMIDASIAHLGSADWTAVATGETLLKGCSLPAAATAFMITTAPPGRHDVRGDELYRYCLGKLESSEGKIEELGARIEEARP